MVVRKYPADFGHTTVINNLCIGLKKLGYDTTIGAFSFESDPPNSIPKVQLNKFSLLFSGIDKLGFDILHTHQAFPNYFLLFKKPSIPIIFHYHGASNFIQRINFKVFMALFKNRLSKIISVSKSGITQMNNMIGDVSAEVVYNGVDCKFYNTSLPEIYKKGDPQLLFVSGLRRYKRADVLINFIPKLLKKFPNIHLQIVGKGEEYEKLKKLIQEQNLQNHVELTGKISNDELKHRYSSCDVYVSASTFEVCPVPTLEAMACGKPLLLFDIEPHKEIVNISHAGIIFHDDDFTSKLFQVFENKNEFSKNAQNFAKSLDWENICKQMAKIYEEN
ncbi:MAG: glycosyl transferase family 1 [Thaumarchaeota archaeon]|jgi:glycosyltransferase involved in cell wall biosynthesis|nr:MAG: glycosyl transferase family 1 [Nitrososphaerota archaeon]